MTWYQRILCFIGFHPPHPHRFTPGKDWSISHFVMTGWWEKCPRCGRWHEANDLAWEHNTVTLYRWEFGPIIAERKAAEFRKHYEATEGLYDLEGS